MTILVTGILGRGWGVVGFLFFILCAPWGIR